MILETKLSGLLITSVNCINTPLPVDKITSYMFKKRQKATATVRPLTIVDYAVRIKNLHECTTVQYILFMQCMYTKSAQTV